MPMCSPIPGMSAMGGSRCWVSYWLGRTLVRGARRRRSSTKYSLLCMDLAGMTTIREGRHDAISAFQIFAAKG
jgi:hypothetical protein